MYYDDMDKFSALAETTRRKMLELLAEGGPLSARDISAQFTISPPAVSQHLKILREAGLVHMEKKAQQRIYHINPEALHEVEAWTVQVTHLWNRRFDTLDRVLAVEKQKLKMEQHEKINGMEDKMNRELTLTRTFDAPRELVFRAWTDPHLVSQWWGPDDFTNPTCQIDARPGGTIYIVMRGPDGAEYPMRGVFREVVPFVRLVFFSVAVEDEKGNSQFEVLTTVTFAEMDNQTILTLRLETLKILPAAEWAFSGMEAGWTQSLAKLANYLDEMRGENG